jgi:hypothetical protein
LDNHETLDRQDIQSGDVIFIATAAALFRKVARSTSCRASHVGIAFQDPVQGIIVAESAIPWSPYTPLDRFIARSDDRWYVVRRPHLPLSATEVECLRAACDVRMGILYHLGFDFQSTRQFCSKFVHEVYNEALGWQIGKLERIEDILVSNPNESIGFWRWWFFGRIPWQRLTVTPASRLRCETLYTVFESEVA